MRINSARSFGVEIECLGLSRQCIVEELTNAGIDCRVEEERNECSTFWNIVPDGSIPEGDEIVSPILSGNEGLAQIQKVSEVLTKLECYTDERCGFHVHVDARDLNGITVANVAKRYAKHETVIDAFMSPRRRQNVNKFCKSMSWVTDNLANLNVSATKAEISIISARMLNPRYYKVNLQALTKHGTIEFRQHAGIISASKMIPWVIFCVNFVETSIVKVIQTGQVNDKLRKNAIEPKLAKIAFLLKNASYHYPVSKETIAQTLGIKEQSVPAYMSAFKAKYPNIVIRTRYTYGYFTYEQQLLAQAIPNASQMQFAAEYQNDNGPFTGLDKSVLLYFKERTQDFR